MKLVDINFKPTQEELLKFGKTMIIGFAVFAAIAYFIFHKPLVAGILLGFGILSFILSRFGKAAILVYIPWMGFALVMGTIVSNLILAILFFGIITPIALVFKLIGRDSMNRGFTRKEESYWQNAENRDNHGVEEYQKQF